MYLVFDVGGTFVKYGILNKEGEVLSKGKTPTLNKDKDLFLDSIKKIYDEHKDQNIEGIAFSVPGVVDPQEGILIQGGALVCMYGQNIANEVSKLCDNLPVSVENDGHCAGLAEAWIGAAKDVPNCCVLGFGTGIAGAVILNKKVWSGSHRIAGEASYLCTTPDVKNCKTNHFAFGFSTIAMVKKVQAALGLEEMNGEILFDLYLNKKDPVVIELMEEFFFNVACQIYNIQYLIDPDVVCIGGGISEQPSLLEGIKKHVHAIYENTMQFREPTVVNCKFNNDSNMIGALYHFLQKYGA